MDFDQVKCAMIPLFKSYTDLNPLLADIRKDMLKKDKNGNTTLDMVAHESAFKATLGFRNDIFDSTGSVTLDLNTDNFGIQTSKHGILPGQPAKGVLQEEARAQRQGDENTKQVAKDDYAGTVARFGKDGKISRESVSLEDIEYGEKTSERPPASMREVDDSTRPSNQTFTDQQKADLEKERPRTNNLNTGINEGKGGNN
jgi:hypothetical protein